MKFQTYKTRADAITDVKKMRKSGWPSARSYLADAGTIVITTHKRGCTCGNCPHVMTDGYVR